MQSLLYAVTALPLGGRRRPHPLVCLVGVVLVSVVEFVAVGSPEGFAVGLAPMIAMYTVGNRLEWRRSWVGLVLALVLGVAWAVFDPLNLTFVQGLSSLAWMTPWMVAWLLGAFVRLNRANVEQRRINREQRAAHAVAEERARIARELHDVIGHSVSVMTVQASAVRRRLSPEQVHGTASPGDRRGTVGRPSRRCAAWSRPAQPGPDTELEPPPGLDQVDRLAEKFRERRAAGHGVGDRGGPGPITRPGSDGVPARAEGLTNTLRHSRNPRSRRSPSISGRTASNCCPDDGQPAAASAHRPKPAMASWAWASALRCTAVRWRPGCAPKAASSWWPHCPWIRRDTTG